MDHRNSFFNIDDCYRRSGKINTTKFKEITGRENES